MKLCKGIEISTFIDRIISKKHQLGPFSFDLTVQGVYSVKKEGDIDFGGSEEKQAISERIGPTKRDEQDRYGWWSLTAGEYIVEFNETIRIPKNHIGIIQPLQRTLKAGVVHPTLFFVNDETVQTVVLTVGKSGFNVKENARISSLLVIKL